MADLYLPGSSTAPRVLVATDSRLDSADEETFDLRGVFRLLRRHIALLVFLTAVVTSLAGFFAYRAKPVYVASGVIRIADTRQAMVAGLDGPGAATNSVLGLRADPVLSQIQILRSRSVAREVMRRHPLGLRLTPVDFSESLISQVALDSSVARDTLALTFGDDGFTARAGRGAVNGTYGSAVRIDGVTFAIAKPSREKKGRIIVVDTAAAMDRFLDKLAAQPRKNTDVIDVSFEATDPAVAQEIVNSAMMTFQELSARDSKNQSRRRREFIAQQLIQTDSVLKQAQVALSNFASNKQIYGSTQVIAAQQTGLLDLDLKRGDLVAERSVYKSLLDSLGRGAAGSRAIEKLNAIVSSPGLAQNPVIVALYQQLMSYEAGRDSMTAGVWSRTATSPDVRRLDTLIAGTRGRLVGATHSQIDALDARIVALDSLKARTAAALQKLPATQMGEERLSQQVEAARKVSDQLRDEFQRARIAEAVEAGQVEVVDVAPMPDRPIGRTPLTNTLFGFVLGLLIAVGAAFLSEHLNNAIQRREDIEKILRVPGLAIVPQILPAKGNGALRGGIGRALPASTNGKRNGHQNGAALVAATQSRSAGAEAFRTLRTNLVFSQAVQTLRVIGITSSGPAEGKTTTAANLSATFAQQGMRVIVLDCDLRRPRLHDVFGQSREPGLTNALIGQMDLDLVVRETGVPGLSFLPTGALPPNPAELLGGARMKEILSELRSRYDVVLVDMPPVHVAADALILSRETDGMVVVVRAGKTDRNAALDALKSLAGVGARVIGAVLNDPDHKVESHAGYYYYDYYSSNESAPAESASI